jgi:multiple sugar transport system permease protein
MQRRSIKLSIGQRQALWAYAFIAIPVLVYYFGIRTLPAVYSAYISFTNWNIVSSDISHVGWANYSRLLQDDVFKQTLMNTFRYVVVGLPIGLFLSFTIAYYLNKVKKFYSLFRTVYFIPFMTSMVAISWVWRMLYQRPPLGLFNRILNTFGLMSQQFLRSPQQALYAILAPTIWQQLGFETIIFLAAMQGIPEFLYEAADIDGANNRQKLFNITIPLLRPTFIFLVITGTIKYLRMFTQVYNMTTQGDGGPLNSTKTVVLYVYDTAFRSFNMGYASAISMVLFLIILAITLFQLKVLNKNE